MKRKAYTLFYKDQSKFPLKTVAFETFKLIMPLTSVWKNWLSDVCASCLFLYQENPWYSFVNNPICKLLKNTAECLFFTGLTGIMLA